MLCFFGYEVCFTRSFTDFRVPFWRRKYWLYLPRIAYLCLELSNQPNATGISEKERNKFFVIFSLSLEQNPGVETAFSARASPNERAMVKVNAVSSVVRAVRLGCGRRLTWQSTPNMAALINCAPYLVKSGQIFNRDSPLIVLS